MATGKPKNSTAPKKPPMASKSKIGLRPGQYTKSDSGQVMAKYNYTPGTAGATAKSKPKASGFPKKEVAATRAMAKKIEAMEAAKAKAAATKKARNTLGAPAGRGASVAAAKKTTKGTVTRGKSNPVLDALRNAANSMTTNREKAQNEKMWREGGNRPKTKPKGK